MDEIEKRLDSIDMSSYPESSVQFYTMSNCEDCNGYGHRYGMGCKRIKACKSCHGTRLVLKQDSIKLTKGNNYEMVLLLYTTRNNFNM